jgi:hypothetical protein
MEKTIEEMNRERRRAEVQRNIEEAQKAKELIDGLTSYLGIYGNEKRLNLLISNIPRQHRTHQQDLGTLTLALISHFANLPHHGFDGRNEATVKICKEILENTPSLKEFPDYKLPCI